MFNWICPQCGREVLASYSECPECANKAVATPAPEPVPVAAPVPPQMPAAVQPAPQPVPRFVEAAPATRPPATPTFGQPAYAQPPTAAPPYYMQPPPSRGLPTWLLSIVFALAFVGLGAGVYWAIQHFKDGGSQVSASGTTTVETPAGKAPARPNPYQKFVEVTGVRLYQDAKKKVAARFLVVNHSEGDMADLAAAVEIRARNAKEDSEPLASFQFKVPSLGPNESKELSMPVDTKLKVYELPDWQLIDARVRVTAP